MAIGKYDDGLSSVVCLSYKYLPCIHSISNL